MVSNYEFESARYFDILKEGGKGIGAQKTANKLREYGELCEDEQNRDLAFGTASMLEEQTDNMAAKVCNGMIAFFKQRGEKLGRGTLETFIDDFVRSILKENNHAK